jgi:hypothetical protein
MRIVKISVGSILKVLFVGLIGTCAINSTNSTKCTNCAEIANEKCPDGIAYYTHEPKFFEEDICECE